MKKERPLLGLETLLKPFRIISVKRSSIPHGFTCSMFACREVSDLCYDTMIFNGEGESHANLCHDCFFEWLNYGDDNAAEKCDAWRAGWEVDCDCCEETIEDEARLATNTTLRMSLRKRKGRDECYTRITQSMCLCATCYEEVKNH